MQAILNVKSNEVDERLLGVIKELLSRNVEIVIKKDLLELEEYDRSLSLTEVMGELDKAGYGEQFLSDLKTGFETSELYTRRSDENKAS